MTTDIGLTYVRLHRFVRIKEMKISWKKVVGAIVQSKLSTTEITHMLFIVCAEVCMLCRISFGKVQISKANQNNNIVSFEALLEFGTFYLWPVVS